MFCRVNAAWNVCSSGPKMPAGMRIIGNCCAGVYRNDRSTDGRKPLAPRRRALRSRTNSSYPTFSDSLRSQRDLAAPGRTSAPALRQARPSTTDPECAGESAPNALATASSPPSSSTRMTAPGDAHGAGSAPASRPRAPRLQPGQEPRQQQVRHRHDHQRQQRRGDAGRRWSRSKSARGTRRPRRCPIADGNMPRIIASVVITIGRSRTGPALSSASRDRQALLAMQLVGVVDEQDRVLRHQAHQHHHADHRGHAEVIAR